MLVHFSFEYRSPLLMIFGGLFLTGEVISVEYSLEYGTDTMEMHVGAVEPGERAIVIDDLIATGGTLAAAIRLLGKYNKIYIAAAFLLE